MLSGRQLVSSTIGGSTVFLINKNGNIRNMVKDTRFQTNQVFQLCLSSEPESLETQVADDEVALVVASSAICSKIPKEKIS